MVRSPGTHGSRRIRLPSSGTTPSSRFERPRCADLAHGDREPVEALREGEFDSLGSAPDLGCALQLMDPGLAFGRTVERVPEHQSCCLPGSKLFGEIVVADSPPSIEKPDLGQR